MRPYSMELRRRVVAACDRKDGRRVEIAERFGVYHGVDPAIVATAAGDGVHGSAAAESRA